MQVDTNNTNIVIGSVKKVLDMRLILGDGVSAESIVTFNTLKRILKYSIAQYNAGNIEYSTKIKKLENLLLSLKYGCPSICNYYKQLNLPPIDFKASNNVITIDTEEIKISELQIPQ